MKHAAQLAETSVAVQIQPLFAPTRLLKKSPNHITALYFEMLIKTVLPLLFVTLPLALAAPISSTDVNIAAREEIPKE